MNEMIAVGRVYNGNGGTMLYGTGSFATNILQQQKGRKSQGRVGRWSER
jgi:hypothetical protein